MKWALVYSQVVCTVACCAVVFAGRYATFHMTEGEALVAGWPYWFWAVVFAGLSGLCYRRLKHA